MGVIDDQGVVPRRLDLVALPNFDWDFGGFELAAMALLEQVMAAVDFVAKSGQAGGQEPKERPLWVWHCPGLNTEDEEVAEDNVDTVEGEAENTAVPVEDERVLEPVVEREVVLELASWLGLALQLQLPRDSSSYVLHEQGQEL